MKQLWPIVLLLSACGLDPNASVADDEFDISAAELRLPKEDKPSSLDVMSWNVEWLGDTENGPTDERLQVTNVARVLRATAPELIGLVEVVSAESFATILGRLPNHRGLLVTDPLVERGRQFYSQGEQKVALIYHKRFSVESARVIATNASFAFGGRPPMEVKLKFTENEQVRQLTLIVAHFKALANQDGYNRRVESARLLKEHMDAHYLQEWVLLVGDLNDDIDVSTFRRSPTPFAPFLEDAAYRFTTDGLTRENVSTTLTFRSTIDHHMAKNELKERFVEGSAKVVPTTNLIPDAKTTTSDHLPVVTRYFVR